MADTTFCEWLKIRLATLERVRNRHVRNGEWVQAGGVAMRMEEIDHILEQVQAGMVQEPLLKELEPRAGEV